GAITAVSASPDGRRLLTASEDGTARLFDAATGKLLHTLDHDSAVTCVAFSADGATAVTGAGGPPLRDGRPVLDGDPVLQGNFHVRAWEADSGKLLGTLTGAKSAVRSVALLSDGRRVVASCFEQPLLGWDLPGKRPLALKAPPLAGALQVAPLEGARVAL